jgi:hypothetical protein
VFRVVPAKQVVCIARALKALGLVLQHHYIPNQSWQTHEAKTLFACNRQKVQAKNTYFLITIISQALKLQEDLLRRQKAQ